MGGALGHDASVTCSESGGQIVVEVVDTEEKIRALKETIDRENWIESGLVTEEKVTIVRYGKNRAPKD